jgi:hypothetical protein
MAPKTTEIAIEKIGGACNGDMRGALEALLLVNEHLEAELHQPYAAISCAPHESPRFNRVHCLRVPLDCVARFNKRLF